MCGRSKFSNLSLLCHQAGITPKLTDLETNALSGFAGDNLPGLLAPVITRNNELKAKTWGYQIKDKLVYNARSESWSEKISFRDNYPILIPTAGFYEGGHLFLPTEGEIVYLAGLSKYDRFVMLTQSSEGKKVQPYYHRCPIVLGNESKNAWIRAKELAHNEELYEAA